MGPLVRPPALAPGDRVAVATLSWAGAHEVPDRFDMGLRQLAATLDVEVVELAHTRSAQDELTPQARADDLHAAFLDPSVRAVVSTIGGDDSIRMLPHVDHDLLAANPTIVLGFSDTVVTQLACLHAGLVSFCGPSLLAGFAENGGMFDYARDGVLAALRTTEPVVWQPNPDGWTTELLDWEDPSSASIRRTTRPSRGWQWLRGDRPVTGRLLPFCIEVLDWFRGTPWWPDLDGALLAIETSEEAMPPDALVRMLRPLGITGELAGLAGLLVGRPGGMTVDGVLDRPDDEAYDAALSDLLDEFAPDLPLVTGLDFGHTEPVWTLPIGVDATLVPDAGHIVVQPGVA